MNTVWGTQEWFKKRLDRRTLAEPSSYFGHKNSGYQRFRHERIVKLLKSVTTNMHKRNAEFLDVGCAAGDLTFLIHKKIGGLCSTGIDFLDEAVEIAKQNYPEVSFEVCNLPELNFESERFNLVLASEVFYYLSAEDRQKCIYSIYRVMAKDGYLLATSTIGSNYFDEDSLKSLLNEKFEIILLTNTFSSFYHRLVRPINLLNRLYSVVCLQEKTEGRVSEFATKYNKFFKLRIIKLPILAANWALTPLLRSKLLPRVCEGISRTFSARPSNIECLVKKKAQLKSS